MNKNFFDEINRFIIDNEPILPTETADEYACLLLSDNKGIDSYILLCKLYNYCTNEVCNEIENLIITNCYELDLVVIYYAIKENVINKFSKLSINIFLYHYTKIDPDKIDVINNDNPIKWISKLCMYGFYSITEMIYFEQFFPKSKLLSFINHPSTFNIEDFRNDWYFLLKRIDFNNQYKKLLFDKKIRSRK